MTAPPKFQFKCNALTLWRDGHRAVVTLTINGRSVRILEADCRTMFFETADPELLKDLSREDFLALRRMRHNLNRPRGDELEAAE